MTREMESELIIEGPESDGLVPADVVVRLLSGIQHLALIFASALEGRPLAQRFKPSTDLKQRYSLICGVPSAGSYHLPVNLVDVSVAPGLFPTEQVFDQMKGFIAAIGSDDREAARKILPDSRYRERALREIRSFAPRRGEGWTASLAGKNSLLVYLDGKVSKNIDEWLRSGIPEETMTVTGELIRINFDENKIYLRVPISHQQLECSYMPDLEVDLLESRRGFIQVTGDFVVDHEGSPIRLTSVTRIQPVDLSPVVIDRVEYGSISLKAKKPIEIIPTLDDETQQNYVLSNDDLDLHVIATTRDELVEEIAQHLVFSWKAYAKEDRAKLTSKAAEFARTLRGRFEETGPNATR